MSIELDQVSAGDQYRSDHGAGRLTATVLRVDATTVTLELDSKKQRRARVFTLPTRFFIGRACGWRRSLLPSASLPKRKQR